MYSASAEEMGEGGEERGGGEAMWLRTLLVMKPYPPLPDEP